MSLEITISHEYDDGLNVTIAGSLDSNTAPLLQERIDSEINDGINIIIINFKELIFLSSAGLRIIFKAKKIMDNRGGKFLLVNMQPQINKVFEIVKALDGMNVFKSQDEMDTYLTTMQNKVLNGELWLSY